MGKILFYDDKRIASIMWEWFGVKFVDSEGRDVNYDTHDDEFYIQSDTMDEHYDIYDGIYYIHPDSYSIFEPREWDVVIFADFGTKSGVVVEVINKAVKMFATGDDYSTMRDVDVCEIILRDNKHFFQCKVEE